MRQTLPLGGHHLYDHVVARRLQRFYDRIAGRRPDARAVLDVGCGPGHLAAALARTHPDADVLGVDLDPAQLRIARHHHGAPNLSFRGGASHALPLPDGSRDWVLATETFHHWIEPERSLTEVHRVLRPGGAFWLVEGAGDMTRAELAAWTGRTPFPGLTWWVRQVFRVHGYTRRTLEGEVLPMLEASPFGGANVAREDGWWVLEMRKQGPGG